MSKDKRSIKCGTINPNTLKIAGKPNRAMTPEVKLAPVWIDRKTTTGVKKKSTKSTVIPMKYGNGGFYLPNRKYNFLRAG
ncbi:MAG: hypothetical protein H6Q72_294 [Firmicutes bacterium]|nr:hypothetical protein [Bacillota bacterium]